MENLINQKYWNMQKPNTIRDRRKYLNSLSKNIHKDLHQIKKEINKDIKKMNQFKTELNQKLSNLQKIELKSTEQTIKQPEDQVDDPELQIGLKALKQQFLFFSVQTTGSDRKEDKIVSLNIITKNFSNQVENFYSKLINPGQKISRKSEELYGISNSSVSNCQTFETIAEEIQQLFNSADIICGYNIIDFDLQFLYSEFRRIGREFSVNSLILDIYTLHKKVQNQKNSKFQQVEKVYNFYFQKELENDKTRANVEIFEHLYSQREYNFKRFKKYLVPFPPICLDSQNKFVFNKKGSVIFNYGKFKGQKVNLMNTDQLLYVQQNDDNDQFHKDTIGIVNVLKKQEEITQQNLLEIRQKYCK